MDNTEIAPQFIIMSTQGKDHSNSEKVWGTAFSEEKKIAENCVNPGAIFGPKLPFSGMSPMFAKGLQDSWGTPQG